MNFVIFADDGTRTIIEKRSSFACIRAATFRQFHPAAPSRHSPVQKAFYLPAWPNSSAFYRIFGIGEAQLSAEYGFAGGLA